VSQRVGIALGITGIVVGILPIALEATGMIVSYWLGCVLIILMVVLLCGAWIFVFWGYLKHLVSRKIRPIQIQRRWSLILIIITLSVLGLIFGFIYSQASTSVPILTSTPTPTVIGGLQLSHPSPQEIYDNISQIPAYLQNNARQNYTGLSVTWDVKLFSENSSPSGELIYCQSIDDMPVLVSFTTNISAYPQLQIMETGQEFIVQGTITSVTPYNVIELSDCQLTFP
jgi:hypothetical protein